MNMSSVSHAEDLELEEEEEEGLRIPGVYNFEIPEVIHVVMQYLEIHEIVKMTRVSKTFRKVGTSDLLWNPIVEDIKSYTPRNLPSMNLVFFYDLKRKRADLDTYSRTVTKLKRAYERKKRIDKKRKKEEFQEKIGDVKSGITRTFEDSIENVTDLWDDYEEYRPLCIGCLGWLIGICSCCFPCCALYFQTIMAYIGILQNAEEEGDDVNCNCTEVSNYHIYTIGTVTDMFILQFCQFCGCPCICNILNCLLSCCYCCGLGIIPYGIMSCLYLCGTCSMVSCLLSPCFACFTAFCWMGRLFVCRQKTFDFVGDNCEMLEFVGDWEPMLVQALFSPTLLSAVAVILPYYTITGDL